MISASHSTASSAGPVATHAICRRSFPSPVDVPHEPGQVFKTAPETVDLADRDLQTRRFSNMLAAIAAEGTVV
jgi:hypothetical protein